MGLTLTTRAVYTEDKVRAAAKGAAAMLAQEISGSERDEDLIRLMVEATLRLLHNPDATFADVAEHGYQLPPQEIKSWWIGWG